jgi:hypothetical protein
MSYTYDNDSRVTGITYKFNANTLSNVTYAYAGKRLRGVGPFEKKRRVLENKMRVERAQQTPAIFLNARRFLSGQTHLLVLKPELGSRLIKSDQGAEAAFSLTCWISHDFLTLFDKRSCLAFTHGE